MNDVLKDYLEEPKYSNKQLKEIKHLLSNLQESEYIEIFNIIRSDTDKYTINNYGVHINMNKLTISTIKKLEEFITFSNLNKNKHIEEKDRRNQILQIIDHAGRAVCQHLAVISIILFYGTFYYDFGELNLNLVINQE